MIIDPQWPLLGIAGVALFATLYDLRYAGSRLYGAVRLVVAMALILICLRPATSSEIEAEAELELDVLLVLDRTASMGAQDGPKMRDRITAAGSDLADLVASYPGAHIGVITFDDEARLAVPSTTDHAFVSTFVTTVGWRPSAKATGSDVAEAAPLAAETLAQWRDDHPERRRVFVYAGDGEQTAQQAPDSFEAIAEYVDDAWVLGYGTTAGGTMPVAPDDHALVTFDGVVQRSNLDEATLKQIAIQTGGEYLHRDGAGELPVLVSTKTQLEVTQVPGDEYYWIIALVALPAALTGLAIALVRWRRIVAEIGESA